MLMSSGYCNTKKKAITMLYMIKEGDKRLILGLKKNTSWWHKRPFYLQNSIYPHDNRRTKNLSQLSSFIRSANPKHKWEESPHDPVTTLFFVKKRLNSSLHKLGKHSYTQPPTQLFKIQSLITTSYPLSFCSCILEDKHTNHSTCIQEFCYLSII